MPQDVLVAWSGGKDSALALREILGDARYRVLRRQAEALGLPLEEVVISPGASNDEYETNMGAALAALRMRISGLDTVVFGDLFRRAGKTASSTPFVYSGPGLRQPVCHQRGAVVVRDGRFVYCDLVETASR